MFLTSAQHCYVKAFEKVKISFSSCFQMIQKRQLHFLTKSDLKSLNHYSHTLSKDSLLLENISCILVFYTSEQLID